MDFIVKLIGGIIASVLMFAGSSSGDLGSSGRLHRDPVMAQLPADAVQVRSAATARELLAQQWEVVGFPSASMRAETWSFDAAVEPGSVVVGGYDGCNGFIAAYRVAADGALENIINIGTEAAITDERCLWMSEVIASPTLYTAGSQLFMVRDTASGRIVVALQRPAS